MPRRSYRKVIDEELDNFAIRWAAKKAKDEKEEALREGKRTKVGVVFSARKRRIGIFAAAKGFKNMIIKYKKTTTGEVKEYKVAPYSYRYRRLKVGRRRMLFAYDHKDRHIKGFALRNILQVTVLPRSKFNPIWPVEI
jgi:hypothetical protein